MVATPAATPFTMPDVPTDAVPDALLLHAPPGVALLRVTLLPMHTAADAGDIAAGEGFTVIVLDVKHPDPVIYVIDAVPADTPVTMPDETPTVATAVLLLNHVPPLVAEDNVAVLPVQILTAADGVIAAGLATTVTSADA